MERTVRRRPVIVRDARPDQFVAVAGLLAACYAEHASSFPTPMWATYRREIAAVAKRIEEADLVVAVVAGVPVGTVTLYRGDGSDGDWPVGVASLRLLAVRPDMRARGIGERLVEECLVRSLRRGCTHLGLHTAPFMRAGVRLYERMGFVRVPEWDFDAHDRYEPGSVADPRERITGLAYRKDLEPSGTQTPLTRGPGGR